MDKEKKVLLFGSGLMAEAVVSHLLRNPNVCFNLFKNMITIATNLIEEAKKISERTEPKRCQYTLIDVTKEDDVLKLIEKSDIVISYVPAFLHLHIAKACLKSKKNLVTASYISPEMNELDK